MGEHRNGHYDSYINNSSFVLFIEREMHEEKGILYNGIR